MVAATDQFKINLNQNLWGLVIGFATLGVSEHYNLHTLYWFAVTVSVIMVLSISFTTLAYTKTYWKQRH